MQVRHAVALTLVGWYLIVPPQGEPREWDWQCPYRSGRLWVRSTVRLNANPANAEGYRWLRSESKAMRKRLAYRLTSRTFRHSRRVCSDVLPQMTHVSRENRKPFLSN
jgi:hypothetical protein